MPERANTADGRFFSSLQANDTALPINQEGPMRTAMLLLLLVSGSAGDGWAGPTGSAVDVQIRSDTGRILPLYPVATPSDKPERCTSRP